MKLLVIALLSSTVLVSAQQPVGKTSSWNDFNVFETKVSSSSTPDYVDYQGRFDSKSSDGQVDIQISENGKVRSGKILLIGGRVLATQGPIVEKGYEIDTLDAAVLQRQVVIGILEKVFPKGPKTIGESREIDFAEEKESIRLGTQSAGGEVAVPWHARGTIREDSTGFLKYYLQITAQNFPAEVTLAGQLSREQSVRVDDAFSLSNWEVFGLGVHESEREGGKITDYSAARESKPYKTVGDVRKRLGADDFPGESDPTKNFTGFWKEKCEDAFGLQILPHGNDGQYTVGFCGPGGCDDPAEERPTFITKDPHYEVVNDDMIKEGDEIYRRCTNDPHPVLKYKDDR